MPRLHRLTSPADFRRVIRSGRKAVRPGIIIHSLVLAVESNDTAPARVGVTVSKAVGGSVTRHRVARVIRHAFAEELSDVPAGSLWVVRALPLAGVAGSNPALAEDVRSAVADLAGVASK